jgi:hypothetical protein
MAAVSASTTVKAIGWNILPSMPVSANTGRYTAVMMATPNRLGRITSALADGGELEAFVATQHAPQFVLAFAEATQAVLDDDHGAVDDQAEVQRAQAHQVARDTAAHHAGDGHQHRDGNHGGRDQCRAKIAQQQEQHRDHQQRAFDQVPLTVAMVRSTSAVRS